MVLSQQIGEVAAVFSCNSGQERIELLQLSIKLEVPQAWRRGEMCPAFPTPGSAPVITTVGNLASIKFGEMALTCYMFVMFGDF